MTAPANAVYSPFFVKSTCKLVKLDDSAGISMLEHLAEPLLLAADEEGLKVAPYDQKALTLQAYSGAAALVAILPPALPGALGSASFCREYGLKYAYVGGGMANGIASVKMVAALAKAGMLGFFGTGGLSLANIEKAILELKEQCGEKPFGCNLLHNPYSPAVEEATVDLYLKHGVTMVEAAAYLDLTKAIVRYRLHGLKRDSAGQVVAPNKVMAKISRIELARKFLAPPPLKLVNALLAEGKISQIEAELSQEIPMAGQITVEADSGGHTDKGAFITLLPTILALKEKLVSEYGYKVEVHIGGGGGIATPAAAYGAFAMGADYLVTGTVNQAAMESGTSDLVKELLATAEQPDVTMAPAADMFEMGVKLQVLKRGTFFPGRAQRLFDDYKAYNGLENMPESEIAYLEKNIFKAKIADIWGETAEYWQKRDPDQLAKAAKNGRHKFALICRWYLGFSSRWAIKGEKDRQGDFQIWCGPAIGAFNEWTRGTFLADYHARHVDLIALNILYGAALLRRQALIKAYCASLTGDLVSPAPRSLVAIKELIR